MIKYNQQRIRGKLQSHCPLKVVIPILLIELIKLRNNFESWFSVSVPFFQVYLNHETLLCEVIKMEHELLDQVGNPCSYCFVYHW